MKNTFVLGLDDHATRKEIVVDLHKLVDTRMLVQANSGGGKSWMLRRLAEATSSKIQTIILDPEGEFVTLREVGDFLIVGKEGDVPADPRSAGLLARRLLELGVSAVVDLYDLKVQQRKAFVRYFLESLMTLPKELWHPAFIILDEAHLFCPEAAHGEAESTQAVIDLCSQGRKRGYAAVLATQRLSKLQKDAAAELNNVLIGRTTLDVDMKRAADILGWGTAERQRLRRIAPGWFQFFGPAFCGEETGHVQVGEVRSSHPKAGKRHAIKPPKPSAALQGVLKELSDLPKQADEEAKTLADAKKQITDLRRQLAAHNRGDGDPQRVQAAIERAVAAAVAGKDRQIGSIFKHYVHNVATLDFSIEKLQDVRNRLMEINPKTLGGAKPSFPTAGSVVPVKMVSSPKPVGNGKYEAKYISQPLPSGAKLVADGLTLGKGPMKILTAIAQSDPTPCTEAEITILTGYKSTSKYEYIKQLKAAGVVVEARGGYVCTDIGFNYLGEDFVQLPTGDALREYWLKTLSGGPEKILRALADAYPESLMGSAIEEATGYKSTSRYEYTKKLKALRLVVETDDGLKLDDKLFD